MDATQETGFDKAADGVESRALMIRIRGARQHNLKGVDLDIPKDKLVVITGPSGCGKSSLAFHTLFAEGRRRYVESLSVYARQFLDQLDKPDVDSIEGLSPAIAIEQRSGGLSPRSTVATATEIYDYLRVLWAALGVPHDPKTGERLQRMGPADIVASLADLPEGSKVVLLAPVPTEELDSSERLLGDLQRQGFIRVRLDGEVLELEEAAKNWPDTKPVLEIVIDRFVVRPGSQSRMADSVETALHICGSEARATVQEPAGDGWRDLSFQASYRNPKTGFVVDQLSPKHFSFNSHLGACACCEGLGTELFCDPDLFVADPKLPLLKGGIRGWWPKASARARKFSRETQALLSMFELSEKATLEELPKKARNLMFEGGELLTGWKAGKDKKPQTKAYEGLAAEAWRMYSQAKSELTKRRLSRVMAQRPCEACGGLRLKPQWLAVKVDGSKRSLGIQELCQLSVADAMRWIGTVQVGEEQLEVAKRLLGDIGSRLGFLQEVGLDYLTLDRGSATLSGGEAQRIRLATQLGAGLSGVIYVLDEPSIGLHAADNDRLIGALTRLRDLGNTVVVVEHDEAIIRAADHVVDMGPGAGSAGGQVLAQGSPENLKSPTGVWLKRSSASCGTKPTPTMDMGSLCIRGASEHNLQDIDVTIPLGQLVALCGPSGSGKSTLINDILLPALSRQLDGKGEVPGAHKGIEGMEQISKCVIADQSPIGRSPRSNPATFTGAFDHIRQLFAQLPLSKQRGYKVGRFSFNATGGRCERCQGNGRLKIEMHFLPDAWVECQACRGKRFNRETLEVTWKGRSIAEVLELTVAEALELFWPIPKLRALFATLDELGLGYLKLGQAANTLSGGEAQRLKLAVELAKPPATHTLYVFDEPTTGLHFGDVERLLGALRSLRDTGHSVLVIEHHLDVIAASDHVIELGLGGGIHGGRLVAKGTPAQIRKTEGSPTGKALKA